MKYVMFGLFTSVGHVFCCGIQKSANQGLISSFGNRTNFELLHPKSNKSDLNSQPFWGPKICPWVKYWDEYLDKYYKFWK